MTSMFGRKTIFSLLLATAGLASAQGSQTQEPVPIGSQFQLNVVTTDFQGNPTVASRDDGSFVVVWESDANDEGDLIHRLFDSTGTPLTDEQLVNSQTAGEQSKRNHAVSVFPDGGFVVTWDGGPQEGDTNVYARRFFADGAANGDQFQVHDSTSGEQVYPSVAAGADGGFAVVWTSDIPSEGPIQSTNIRMRLWDSSGVALGPELPASSETSTSDRDPAIIRSGSGEYLVVWTRDAVSEPVFQAPTIRARRFLSDGTPIDEEFQVNDYTEDEADTVKVAAAANGDFVVTWRSYASPGDDTSDSSTQARRFATNGSPIGLQFQVNTFTTGYNDDPDLVFDPQGGFLVVWESEPPSAFLARGTGSPDGSGNSTQGRRFLADGTPVGNEFTVNDLTEGPQDDPVVAILGPERAIVIFESATSSGGDTSDDSVQARLLDLCPGPNDGIDADEDGVPDDCDACQGVNSTGDTDADDVCDDLDICVGDDASGDVDGDGLCADRDCNDNDAQNGCAIFADGFESGDIMAWL